MRSGDEVFADLLRFSGGNWHFSGFIRPASEVGAMALRVCAAFACCLAFVTAAPARAMTEDAAASAATVRPHDATDDKYELILDKAIAALAVGNSVDAEKFAFTLTVIDPQRFEGFVVYGAALAKQGRTADAKAAMAESKALASGDAVRIPELIEVLADIPRSSPLPGNATNGSNPTNSKPVVATVRPPRPITLPAPVPGPEPRRPGTLVAQPWAEVLDANPDRKIVVDAAAWAQLQATPLPWRVRDKQSGIEMRLVPAGDFKMGSPEAELERDPDEVSHEVKGIKAFYLSVTEVDQDAWKKVMSANPSASPAGANPVDSVTWDDCQSFCNKLGMRLPSEAEWEYACRAGRLTPFSFGETVTPDQVNYDGNYPYASALKGTYRAAPVACGSLPANPWGFHEMHGNLSEWCQDVKGGYANISTGAPVVEGDMSRRVMRGGSWVNSADHCRSARRASVSAATDRGDAKEWGFRVARTPDAGQSP